MSEVLLSEFLRRVQKAGVNLSGCLIATETMEVPHVLKRLIVDEYGRTKVEVVTETSHTAHLISHLVVESVSMEPSSRLIPNNQQVLKVFFAYA